MTPEKFQALMDLFQRALALDGQERPAFIDRECGGDAELRLELQALLGEPAAAANPLVTAGGLEAVRQGAGSSQPAAWRGGPSPVLSGNYRLLRVLGEGGMGIVYQAEQAFPRRLVALKAMRPGLMSGGLLRRFQNEAQILARLQHPGIAQIYEAGAADEAHADQAFFAMEYVDGLALTDFARQRTLNVEDRLGLMIRVCDAVQHAHQRGVIHRDLKPSNILVDSSVDPPQPKILDFGVARVSREEVQGLTMQTDVGQLVGTLPYMSPEQVSADPGEVDTRSDVYALGVILYQLLVDRLPFDLSSHALADAARIIRDESPSRVSTLDRSLRGDLDTIVAKALEKDKQRRYQSAAELGEDLRRFLAGEPIAAKRDSLGYVLQKKVRRYRWVVAASVAFMLIMAGFLVHAVMQARELAERLSIANIERGRALFEGGSVSAGEDVLWREFLQNPDSARARWTLRDLYARRPVLRTLDRSTIQPSTVIASPDGRLVAFTGLWGRAGVWSRDLSHALWERPLASSSINDAAFLPDSRRLVVILDQKLARVVDAPTGDTILEFAQDLESPTRMDLLADGSAAVVTALNGDVAIYDLDTGRQKLRRTINPKRFVFVPRIAPDGRTIILGGSDGGVTAWPLDLERPRWRTSATGQVSGLAFVDEGRTLVAGCPHRLYWIDPESGQIIDESPLATDQVHDLTLLDQGRTLAVGGNRCLEFIDVAARRPVRTLSADPSHHFAVVEGTDHGTLIVAGVAATAQVWQIQPDPAITTLAESHGGWVLGLSISTDGSRLLTTDSAGGGRLWDLARMAPLTPRLPVGASGLRTGVLSADGGLAYVGNVTGEIQVRSGEGLEESRAIAAFDSGISGLDLSPDESTLVALTVDGHAALWDSHTGAKLHDLGDGHKQANSARFSPNSRRVAIAGREPAVSLWDVATGRLLHQISSDSMAFAAAFSPDGRWLAYTARLRRIEIADASTLATVRVLEGHSHVPVCVAFSPDGRIVASGAADGAVRLWEAGTGGALSTIRFGDSEISRIVFTPDGRRLIAAGRQGKVWVCDLAYFDRHIAGNARFQAARQKDWIPPSTDTAPLFRWADAVLADVTPAATPSPAVPGAAE